MKPLQDRENRRIVIRNKEGTSPEISPEALKRTPDERKNENKTKLTPSKTVVARMRSHHGCRRRRKIAATSTTQQRQERSPVEKKTLSHSLSEAFQGSETPVPVVLIASLFRSFTFAWISSFSSALMRTPALNEERRVMQCKRSTDDASIY
jgi:hypothetical protein